MTKAIIKSFVIVLLLSLAITSLSSFLLISQSELRKNEKEMLYITKVVSYKLDYQKDLQSQIDELKDIDLDSKPVRFSIIDQKGNVVFDTYRRYISENHLNRAEVHEAMTSKNHTGMSTRRSDTTNELMIYTAYYTKGYVVRLSVAYHGIYEYLPTLVPALAVSILIAFLISMVIARYLGKRINRPLTEIDDSLAHMSDDFRFELHKYPYEEFNHITDTIEDLSHRLRKSMRETQFEQKKIDDIIDQMKEGFILLDEKHNILSVNQAAIEILGELKEKDHLDDHIEIPELIEAVNSDEDREKLELKIDHEYYKCYLSKFPFGTALFFVNVTAVKKNEKMREEFFSSVSHELKTPITSIRGYAELLLTGMITDDKQQKQMLEKILTQVSNMSNLINDILMLSRLDNDDLAVEMVPMKMCTLVDDVVENYDGTLMKEDITIEKEVENLTYVGNHQQIANLLSNLISNAIKYNKPGGKVFVRVYKHDTDMIMEVEDTGIGIPKKDQKRVFERFYRVDKGRSRAKGGTGLGLAIVKHVVAYNGGHIDLDSKLGVGTRITITLPFKNRNAKASQA